MAHLQLSAALLAALALAIWAPHQAHAAIKWSTKTIIMSNWTVDFTNYNTQPIPNPCPYIGVCKPGVITLDPNTTWIWCNGWEAIHRTQYWLTVQNATANISAVLMPQSEVDNCALATNGAGIKNCGVIDTSPYACESKTKCYVKVVGLVFNQNICLVVANNNQKPNTTANVSVQMWNYHDQPRYIGTVFTVILFVAWCLGIIAYFAISCTKQFKSPAHRLNEMLQVDRYDSAPLPETEQPPTSKLAAHWQNLKQRLPCVTPSAQ